jgi:alpha-beta hydrolase superfamily lysophospholipase
VPASPAPGCRTLFGTIWKAGDSKLAAVIITGSGPGNRNGDSTVNRASGTYRLIAEGLQAHGISALSIDKRGIGESAAAMPSEGVLRVQTYGDDIRAWAHELKARTAARCVWLVGHSEGALVAELATAGNADICGIVTMAGMGRKPADVLRAQLGQNLTEPLKSQAFAVIAALEKGQTVPNPPQELMGLFRPSVQPYMISELALDPAALLKDLKVPVLILQGDADVQVSVADAQALAAARPDATLKILPGVNHNQRLDKAPRPAPLAPGLTETIAQFLKAHS